MAENNITLKNSLEEYLDEKNTFLDQRFIQDGLVFIRPMGEANKQLYFKLSEYKAWELGFEPLSFFHLIYDHLSKILTEEDSDLFPGEEYTRIYKLKLDPLPRGLFLFSLKYLIGFILEPTDFKENVLEKQRKIRPLNRLHMELTFAYLELRSKVGNEFLPDKIDSGKNVLESKQIALICYYNGINISNPQVGAEIAAEYGRRKKTSGQELYGDFCDYKKKCNRCGNPESERKLNNMIRIMESIRAHLKEKAIANYTFELNELKKLSNY